MFEKVKRFFDLGLYTKEQVATFVRRGVLTEAQYEEITHEPYGGEHDASVS